MRFAARQPVFRRNMTVFGYEILFRSGFEAVASFQDSDQASCVTLDNSILWGLEQLCADKLAFVNCTRSVLTNRLIELLPPSRTVIEVLEDVLPDREVLEACRALKEKGYLIALDDVRSLREVEPYFPLADIVKVDFRLANGARQQEEMAREIRGRGMRALAEKVENEKERRAAINMGYELFQGFFFQRPEIVHRKDIGATHSNCLRLLTAAHQPELDRQLIEKLVRAEPSLSLRLLRYLNSVAFAFRVEVTSIRHALTLLGEQETRKWLLVTAVAENCIHKPSELVIWALARARFCELVAVAIGDSLPGAFWMGMLSALPALLEISLPTVLEQLPIASAVKQALLGEPGSYRSIFEMMSAYECGDWGTCTERAHRIGIGEPTASALYIDSTKWASEVTGCDAGKRATGQAQTGSFASYRPPDAVVNTALSRGTRSA